MSPAFLLLDHDEGLLFSMWQYLTGAGCRLDCARSLDEAEDLWNRNRYAAVITDLRLRGIHENEGLALVSYIRERCPHARIILLTSYGSRFLELEARRRGAAGFLYPTRPAGDGVEAELGTSTSVV